MKIGFKTNKKLLSAIFTLMGCLVPVLTVLTVYYFFSIPDKYRPYMIDLSGQWKIHEGLNQEWTKPSYNDDTWKNIQLPGGYYNQGFRAKYSVIRKEFTLKRKMLRKDLFFIIGGTCGSMGDVYINGHKIGEIGLTVNNRKTQGVYDKYGFFISKEFLKENDQNKPTNVIAIIFYHEALGDDGVQDRTLIIGTADYFGLYYNKVKFITLFFQYGIIFTGIFLLAIIFLLLITEWQTTDRYKYISTMMIILAAIFYTATFSNSFLKYWISFQWSDKLSLTAIPFVALTMIDFLQYFFFRKINLLGQTNRIVCLTVMIATLFINSILILITIYKYFAIYLLLSVIYICVLSFKATLSLKTKRYGILITSSVMVLSIVAVSDLLADLGLGFRIPQLFNIAVAINVFISSVVIIVEFINLYNINKDLTNQLTEINTSLEIIVENRTKELKVLNERLKKLNNQKNEFIANITHDFRSPLTVILNMADLAMKTKTYSNKDTYNTIYEASLKLNNSINKLLNLAKLDSQGMRLEIQKTDPILLLTEIINFYSSALIGRNITIIKNFPAENIDDFYTDQTKLEEVISNIISNAIKFADPEKGIINIELQEKKDKIVISIQDNGIGIPKDKLKVIFNRFEQVNSGRNSSHGGIGIGLAYAKQLVKLLKGKIRAESEGEGKGAKFIIELKKGKEIFNPSDFAETEKCGPNSTTLAKLIQSEFPPHIENDSICCYFQDLNKADEFNYKKGKILIIDDDRNIRGIIMNYLAYHGYINFITAADGKEGLNAVYQYLPDLIICDFNMPNMPGDMFHDILLNDTNFSKIPFLFLSAITDKNIMMQRREKGASAYLKKPIDEKELLLTVDQYLQKHFDYLKTLNLATIDELSGLNNRREIINRLEQELSVRSFRNLSVVFFDIDDFKKINDEYGHQIGDQAIALIGKTVKSKLRHYDIPGRYGGDEFLLILPDTDLRRAVTTAEELKEKISANKIRYENKEISITSSFGVASLIDNRHYIEKQLGITNLEDIFEIKDSKNTDWNNIEGLKQQIGRCLIKMADEALYKAKSNYCNKCGYISQDPKWLEKNECPQCNSSDITYGKNRIIAFGIS